MRDRSDLERVKAALADPRDVAGRLGLIRGKVTMQGGGGILVCCPAHGDRTPSCSLTRGRDGTLRVKCHGCDLAGDIFDLIAAIHSLDRNRNFRDVIEHAAGLAGIALDDRPGEQRPALPPPKWEPPPPPPPEAPADRSFDLVVRTLLELCPLAGETAEYVRKRGVLEEARADGWGALPPRREQGRVLGELTRRCGKEAVEASGLLFEDAFSWHDRRLLIPYRAHGVDGLIVNLQRRTTDSNAPKASKYVFPRGKGVRDLYGLDLLAELGDTPIVYVEGAFDVLARRRLDRERGIERAVLGLPGVKNRIETAWAVHARGRVAYIAFDADKAGAREIQAAGAELHRAGAKKVIHLEPIAAKDWTAILESRA